MYESKTRSHIKSVATQQRRVEYKVYAHVYGKDKLTPNKRRGNPQVYIFIERLNMHIRKSVTQYAQALYTVNKGKDKEHTCDKLRNIVQPTK